MATILHYILLADSENPSARLYTKINDYDDVNTNAHLLS